jgi:hypothetical protein
MLVSKYREKWACFAYFGVTGGEISLQLRLAGGEAGILRTPDKHRAVRLFFNEFQSGSVVSPSILASSIRLF